MSRYIEGIDRNQLSVSPICLEDMIAENNLVRVIDLLVDSLDMKALGFKYSVTKEVGRKPYNPKDLLKLYIYGYFHGIRSTRKLERECKRNVEVMWLIRNLTPDDKTISNFRQHNPEALINVFQEFSLLYDELDLFGKEVVAIDGSIFKASNSRKKSYTKNKVKKMLKHYEEAASEYISLLDEMDALEDTEKTDAAAEEIKDNLHKAQTRIEELKELAKEIDAKGSINKTDPDSCHMKASNNGTDISHNVQIAVDSKHHLVAAVDVTSSPADQTQLHNMSSQALTNLGIEESDVKKDKSPDDDNEDFDLTVLADIAYYSGEELKKCLKDRIKPIVARQKANNRTGDSDFTKEKFIYDKQSDVYICPAGETLYNTSKKSAKVHVYKNVKACDKCKYRARCTTSKKGRLIKRGEYQETYDIVDKIKSENEELYKQRQMIVEHPFGTVKRNLGYTYFLTRGHLKVKAESHMHFLIYNLIRVINIRGVDKLLEDIEEKRGRFLNLLFNIFGISKNSLKFA